MARIEVFNPGGAVAKAKAHAPRLADLRGKTVCEISAGVWEHYRTFPVVRELLLKRFPDLKIIPYTEFPKVTVGTDVDQVGALVKSKGVDAVIVGNAR